jgi:hypothetical protein
LGDFDLINIMKLNLVLASEMQMFCEKYFFLMNRRGRRERRGRKERKDRSRAKVARVV